MIKGAYFSLGHILTFLVIFGLSLFSDYNSLFAQSSNESKGPINFKNATLQVADFEYTHFLHFVNFDNSKFASEADFTSAHFDSLAYFHGTHFASEAHFYGAQFSSRAVFGITHFDSKADFRSSKFALNADFRSAQFASVADFEGAQFASEAYFTSAHFDSLAYFHGTHFASEAHFYGAQFALPASFYEAEFTLDADFRGARFASLASFNRAHFYGEIYLRFCVLPDTLYFVHVLTEKEVDFTFARTDSTENSSKKCVIDLYGTDISKLKFDYSRFTIFIDPKKYQRRQISNIYEQVLKMQKAHGFIDGYEEADKEYRHFKLTYDKTGITCIVGAFGSLIQELWWDYGYHKERVVLWTIFFLLLFTFINAGIFKYLNEQVYLVENLYSSQLIGNSQDVKAGSSTTATAGIKFIDFSTLINAFFYTFLIFFGLRLSVEKIKFNHKVGAMYLIIQYSLGIVCLAYLANFIILS